MIFAFTSLGVKLDNKFNNSCSPSIIRIDNLVIALEVYCHQNDTHPIKWKVYDKSIIYFFITI